MNVVKRYVVGAGTFVFSLLMTSGCAGTGPHSISKSDNLASNNNSASIYNTSTGSGLTKRQANSIVLRLKSLAQVGTTDNSPFVAGESSIREVEQKWGHPGEQTMAGQGTYAVYPSKHATYGFNKAGTIFDVRSYSQQVQNLTWTDVRTALGSPKLTTRPTTGQTNEIYAVNSTYQLEFIVDTKSNRVDHVSVFDANAVQSQPRQPVSPVSSGVAIRGVIEGFYGKPWTDTERTNMFQFMQKEHLNTYVYAPKDDPYQRIDWRLPYPSGRLAQMGALVKSANSDGVQFVYSISPGMTGTSTLARDKSITYSSPSDVVTLEKKIDQLRTIGVNTFMLSFDDIEKTLKPADRKVYGTDFAKAQMILANQVYSDEKKEDPNFHLWFVPTYYYGLVDGPYWETLRSTLDHKIRVIWTGKWVLNKTITSTQAKTITQLFGRKPILWDNYPVNDYTYDKGKQHQLMMGPLEGRDADLTKNIAGYISNPMLQPYASKLALATISDYLLNPGSYQPEVAWNNAIKHMPGITNPTLFRTFAAFATSSTLNSNGSSPIGAMILAYQNAPSKSQKQVAQQTLESEFRTLSTLPATLPSTVPNKELLHEIQPWLTKLGQEGQGGLDALAVMNHPTGADKAQLAKQIALVNQAPYNIGGQVIQFMQWAENRS